LKKHCLHNRRAIIDNLVDHETDIILTCGNDSIGITTYLEILNGQKRKPFPVPSLTYLGDTWLAQAWRFLPGYDPWIDRVLGGRRPGILKLIKSIHGTIAAFAELPTPNRMTQYGPITAISQFVVDDLRNAGAPVPANVPMTYVPLHASFFDAAGEPIGHDGSQSKTLRALFVSRVEQLKGPDAAIEGLAKAVRKCVGISLTIAGIQIEKLQPELEALAQSLGIGDRVRFAGTPQLSELISFYRSHDVFLFPSRIVEGLGLVNCEAQACGLPIIGTAGSGAAEVIRHGETGFRIALDDTDAMAEHLKLLATNRELWLRLSKNALVSSKRFHPDIILDTLEQALEDVLRTS
jgi:glycosyltransferase involved in cell wall biosynthesis